MLYCMGNSGLVVEVLIPDGGDNKWGFFFHSFFFVYFFFFLKPHKILGLCSKIRVGQVTGNRRLCIGQYIASHEYKCILNFDMFKGVGLG